MKTVYQTGVKKFEREFSIEGIVKTLRKCSNERNMHIIDLDAIDSNSVQSRTFPDNPNDTQFEAEVKA